MTRIFHTRGQFAWRFGIYGSSMLPLGSVHGGSLPPCKIACLVDGEVKEARSGDRCHRDIVVREAVCGSTVVDGYTTEP